MLVEKSDQSLLHLDRLIPPPGDEALQFRVVPIVLNNGDNAHALLYADVYSGAPVELDRPVPSNTLDISELRFEIDLRNGQPAVFPALLNPRLSLRFFGLH